MIYKPHNYQGVAYDYALNHKTCGLFLDMGLGKTVVTLTLINDLLNWCEISFPIVVAPKIVTEQTWTAEVEKWDHLKHLRISRIIGNEQQRISAIHADADIWAVSRDNIAWLQNYMKGRWFWDLMVIDELSSFKSRKSNRFTAIKKVIGYLDRVIGLTGTPAPNSLLDLWPQLYLLDGGVRLYDGIGKFRSRYFNMIHKGFTIDYVIKQGAEELIYKAISDICISMKAEDCIELPERIDIVQRIELPNMDEYLKFQREKILELPEGEITAVNAPALYQKLLQFCNGAVYDNEEHRAYHIVSEAKLDVLEEEIESLQGKSALIFYQFKSDLERIKKRFPKSVLLKGGEQVEAWNRGEIELLLAHELTAAYGLNMQAGGCHSFWFGATWKLENYLQAIKRLHRQGQKYKVINKILICKGTVEEIVIDRIAEKEENQNKLLFALKKFVDK